MNRDDEDLTAASLWKLKNWRDSGDTHRREAVRIEIERRLKSPPPPKPGAFVVKGDA